MLSKLNILFKTHFPLIKPLKILKIFRILLDNAVSPKVSEQNRLFNKKTRNHYIFVFSIRAKNHKRKRNLDILKKLNSNKRFWTRFKSNKIWRMWLTFNCFYKKKFFGFCFFVRNTPEAFLIIVIKNFSLNFPLALGIFLLFQDLFNQIEAIFIKDVRNIEGWRLSRILDNFGQKLYWSIL